MPVLTELKVAYERENMSPEQIAEDMKLELGAVKAGLMQVSASYRRACGHEHEVEDELNFNNEELKIANQVIVQLAQSAENEGVRLKAATYIRDDKKGRKEVTKGIVGIGGHTTNILFNFNQALKAAKMKAIEA